MNPIIVSHVNKTFRTKTQDIKALQNVSFEVEQGEIFGLLGLNGAGKSTLINIMLNLLTPTSGSVLLLGEKPGPRVLSRINVVAGGSEFHWALTPRDILSFYARIYQVTNFKERIAQLASLLKIHHLRDRKFSWLSTGERLRVAFAKAMLNRPKLLLMDEPTLGLDPDIAKDVRAEIQRLNRETGMTILLTSHYMHEVEQLCSRIAFISKGKIVDIGEVKDVKLKHFGTYEITATLDKKPQASWVSAHALRVEENKIKATLKDEESLSTLLAMIHESGYRINDIAIKKPTLEDYFIKVLHEQ
ncbi:MAG: ABC transporter ATP-binding protein [Candidatus Aenigmarchaeota archaeon]|nr:ABC transporter ATP-binding protein [Candidatus Aenigmarchaeota archaeon]